MESKKKSVGAEGKKFEQDFQNSIPENIFSYRLRDAGGWSNASNTRFTPSNICDTIINHNGHLFLCELKSVATDSMPLGNLGKPVEVTNKKTGEKKLVYKKLDALITASSKSHTTGVYIINFRKNQITYIVTARLFKEIILRTGKQSISLKDIIESKEGTLLVSQKKTTR